MQGAEAQEIVLRFANFRRGSAEAAARVLQLQRVHRSAAGVALVAAGLFVVAEGARALHVAVGQEPAVGLGVEQGGGLPHGEALVRQGAEDVLHHLFVVLGARAGEQVEGDAEIPPRIKLRGAVLVHDLLRGQPLLLGGDGYGRAVLVAARHHEHLVPFQPVVPREDVRGHVAARQVAQVDVAVGVRPGYGDKNLFSGQFASLLSGMRLILA